MNQKPRYQLIDAYRGATLISMIAYHFCYDVFVLYGYDKMWMSEPLSRIWQQSICMSFIVISGFCAASSRNLWKRGLFLNICGCVITAVTAIAVPSAAVYFGILNMLGCSLLLMVFFRRIIHETNWIGAAILSLIGFVLFRHVQSGYVGLGDAVLFHFPSWLYQWKIMTILGFPYTGFRSSDYFPMLPWFFLFLFGYCMRFPLERSERQKKICSTRVPVCSALGRHSLLLYMIHQPVLMGICILLF